MASPNAGIVNASNTRINPATTERQDAIIAALGGVTGSGLPVAGSDAAGADAYATIVTAPARECHNIAGTVGDFGMVISLNAGGTDHFTIPADMAFAFSGMDITAGVAIKTKNLVPGSNYTNATLSVW